MDLIDRYLAVVRRHLPRPLQQDIVEELSDSLRSEAEEMEQRLGRPLTPEDQEQVLKPHGHPWLMASRYQPQQYLIGPALYPYYRQALTIVLFWVVLPLTLGGGAIASLYAENAAEVWARALGRSWLAALYAVGVTTIVFAILEHQHVRITALDNWQPGKLPEPQAGRAVSRTESVFSIVFGTTFALWWMGLVDLPTTSELGGGEVTFTLAPVWTAVYVPVLICLLASVVIAFTDLIRPWRTPLFSALRVVTDLASLVIIGLILRAGHWVEATSADPRLADRLSQVDNAINRGAALSLTITAVILGFAMVQELRRMMRTRQESPA